MKITSIFKTGSLVGFTAALSSCGSITKEDSYQTAGAVGGGALGYSLGESDRDKALYGAVGGLAGGLVTSQLAGNKDFKKGVEKGKEEGYTKGQADTAKRMYWVLQAAQGGDRSHGTVSMRKIEIAPTYTEDGRYLMAREVTVPIVDAAN